MLILLGVFLMLYGGAMATWLIAPTVVGAACFCGILARIWQAGKTGIIVDMRRPAETPAPNDPAIAEAEVTAKQLDRFTAAFKPSGKWV